MKKYAVSLDSNTPIPDFSLPSSEGGASLGPGSYKQQYNLVLFFFDSWSCGHCRRLLRELKEHAPAYRWLDTKILAISQTPIADVTAAAAELEPDVVLLYDEDGKVADAYRDEENSYAPFVVIADRFGAFFERMMVEKDEDLDFHEIESMLMFIETQCPECGRPTRESM